MRCLMMLLAMLVLSAPARADQPYGIRLVNSGVSLIYPVFDTGDWVLTQPSAGEVHSARAGSRVTHWGDDFYAQDWARGCGQTHGHRAYAGISGQVVLAGERGPYGYSVVIYDAQTRFALKYSHLSEIAVGVGEYALAGKTLVGRVGNTGNAQSSSCASSPGAHLHLSLHRNVSNPARRPVTATSATRGSGPTAYAAPFGYATPVELMKTADNPTVYAAWYGERLPVSAGSWFSHGWGFDRHQAVFNPLVGRVLSRSQVSALPESWRFFPFRDYALVRAGSLPTVYQFEDGEKRALSSGVFSCRGNRFGEVAVVSAGERDSYPPGRDRDARGCLTHARQAMLDFPRAHALPGLAGAGINPDWATYGSQLDWDPTWELRWMAFRRADGTYIMVYHATHAHDPTVRSMAYSDGPTGQWFGWYGVP